MGKQHYVVNCYTCQHNGQETCKGCNTLLVGDDEPYENWQLREDLESKDQQIADLETKLAKGVEIINEWMQLNIEKSAEINQLKQQLAEERKKVVQEIKQRLIEYTGFDEEYLQENIYDADMGCILKQIDKFERGE